MIENVPLEIKDQIKNLTLKARSKRIIRILHNYLQDHHRLLLAIFPDIDQPWKTPFAFWITQWTVAHYLYMWYLLNEYYLCPHFELEFYRYIFPYGNRYFRKILACNFEKLCS